MQLDGTYLVEAELMMILMARNRSNNTKCRMYDYKRDGEAQGSSSS